MDMDVFPARIRALQAIYNPGHLALVNWGLWSRDRYQIGPKGVVSPKSFEKATSGLPDGYAEVTEKQHDDGIEAKAEGPEHEPYDDLEATILDQRLHGPGGLPEFTRSALALVYVFIYVMPEKYAGYSGCTQDAFCERLEAGLMFAERFQ